MPDYSSPLLDDFNRTGVVTPGLQRAIDIAKQKLGDQFQFPGVPQAQPSLTPTLKPPGSTPPVPKLQMPSMPGATSQPSPAPAPSMAPQPATPALAPAPSAHQQELTRLTTGETGKSGIDQIHSPWLRALGKIGDIAESTFFPRAAMLTPGTQLHHNMLVRGQQGLVDFDQKQATGEANRQHLAAETAETGQRGEHEQAEADALRNPLPKEEMEGKTIETADGIMQWNPKTHAYDTRVGDAPGKNTGNVHVLPDGTVISVNHDARSGESTANVLYKGDPKTPTEVKQLEISGKPHQVLINSQTGATIKDLGETGEKPPTVNVNTGVAALDRESTHFGGGHQKAVDAANSQLEKIGEARALLSTGTAESQALAVPKVMTALVSGQGSGVRITQPELNAIASARGIKGDFQAWISKISSGKRLTPEQSQQLVQVLDDASGRLAQKRQIANDALNGINGAKSRDEMARIDSEARDKLAKFETGGQAQSGGGHLPGGVSLADIDAELKRRKGGK